MRRRSRAGAQRVLRRQRGRGHHLGHADRLLPGYPTGRTDFDKPTYDAVVAQLKWEWNALDDVHSMFAGLETAYSWAGSSQGTASTIATTITNNMGRPVQRGSSAAGGIISLVQDTLTVATEFGPLLAAQPALPGGGDDDDPAGPATKIAALLGLGNDIMQLAGGNDGGSDAVSIDGIRADALDYAAQLDLQLGQTRDNFVVAENAIVSDPARLSLTAANTGEDWNLPDASAAELRTRLQYGATRSLWTRLVPSAFQLWQFPRVPSDMLLTDLYCNNPVLGGHYIYTGQPDGAIYTSVAKVDGNGAPASVKTFSLTAINDADLSHNVDRVVRQPLLDRLYGVPGADGGLPNAGLAPDEVPTAMGFAPIDYYTLRGASGCAPLMKRSNGQIRGWAQ